LRDPGLTGKVVFVTGAARGIGAAIAKGFAEHGCSLVVGDIDHEGARACAERLGPSALAAPLDVRERSSVDAVVSTIAQKHGGLDVLVNNAGVLCVGAFDSTSSAEWQKLVNVNLTGLFHCVQAATPLMKGRGNASIVNIASISAEKGGGVFGNVWYAATKAAVIAITKGLARELGSRAIRVNAISPGVVDTEMVHKLLTPALRESLLSRIPIGRFTSAADIARAAVFLASDDAAGISGEILTVDGGFLRS
jgi:NAD(P)-dependent dehydrogenase (short-subunit alcohol dehydrogenase family)